MWARVTGDRRRTVLDGFGRVVFADLTIASAFAVGTEDDEATGLQLCSQTSTQVHRLTDTTELTCMAR